MTYEKIRESDTNEVLRHFICIEATRSKYANKRDDMINWTRLSDTDFIQKVRNFEKKRSDENPAILWTIGTEKDCKRPQKVRRWILANINLGCLYTCGINSKMKSDLDSVKGNLKCFVNRGYTNKYDEFCTNRVPTDEELKVIVGIAHDTDDRDGKIEIVDGAHRAIAMLANGIEYSQAHIAKLR